MRRTLFILAALALLAGPSWAIPPFPPAGVSDTGYNETTWDGVTDTAPSKNAVRDKFFSVDAALALKCDESVFGTSVGTGLTLDSTTLKASTVLQKYHGVDPSANVLTLLGADDFAAFRTSLSLVPGTNVQAYNALLADLAGLTLTVGDLIYYDGSNLHVLDAGTDGYYLGANGAAAPSWKNTMAIATLDLHAATSSIPCPYGTASAPTTEGYFYWNTSTDTLTVGNAAAAEEMVTLDNTQTLTGKTYDFNGTGNVAKGYGYITLRRPNNRGSATTAVTTTETNINYGMPTFADDVEANNYIDYFCEVPRDVDTSVDMVAWFKFRLGGADTADHDYIISMVSIADSAAQAGTPGNAINLSYDADASGASGDVETAGGDTLTDWKANVTAGQLWMIRITRDGDDETNDASTVDSYPVELTIRYGWTQ